MLDDRKKKAIALLTLGKMTGPQTAEKLGVKLNTLRSWKHKDPHYKAELAAWQAGPPLSRVLALQFYRLMSNELACRALDITDETPLRDVMALFDRVQKLYDVTFQETNHDDDSSYDRLTEQQAARLWDAVEADAEADLQGTDDDASDES